MIDAQTARADAMERTIQEMLTATPHGDHRPLYRNLATGKASTPVLSEREIEHRRTNQ